MGLGSGLDVFGATIETTPLDAMRPRQGWGTQRMPLSNFDRYYSALAVEANVPPFQDISSD
jgi:hypothetical protein